MKSAFARFVIASVLVFGIAAPFAASAAASLTATPTSGKAPLTVTFTVGSLTSGDYKIRFGDGTKAATLSPIACTHSIPASCVYGATHTYTKVGKHTAKLISGKTKIATVVVIVTKK